MNSNNHNTFNNDFYAPTDLFAAAAAAEERAGFITKTYLYLVGAVLSMVGLEVLYFNLLGLDKAQHLAGMLTGGFAWLVVLVLFMAVQWIADMWARNATNSVMQVAGLALYTVAASIVLFPLLTVALLVGGGSQIIVSAGIATGGLFSLMTLAVFITRKDFSFLRTLLVFGSMAALGLIVISILFGFNFGPIFIYAMIALACGYILYDTSNVLHHYRIGQHAAASLALLASLFILFWYVLQLFLSNRE
ncbi:MAG: Bax inhibitor-1 family protein [Planctomycetaceae bacterium]|jgi:FtsH-binding integral membrane protein|nr:Bax inhibitor-1 family protein [Planctomycetaceae bacterium]